jgi:hypothetical protein
MIRIVSLLVALFFDFSADWNSPLLSHATPRQDEKAADWGLTLAKPH